MFDEQGEQRLRKSRFSEEQIVRIIQEYAAGAKVSELCRKHGMSDGAFYKWKAKYGGQVSGIGVNMMSWKSITYTLVIL